MIISLVSRSRLVLIIYLSLLPLLFRQPILELVPKHLHERSPIFLGSEDDVREVIQIFARHQQLG